jgi:hypothetical protein
MTAPDEAEESIAASIFMLMPSLVSLIAVLTNACCKCKNDAGAKAWHFAEKGHALAPG